MTKPMDESLRLGYDAGNYCAVYETENFSEALKIYCENMSPAYVCAFYLGFFSSFSTNEVGEYGRLPGFAAAYRSEFGQRCIELGFCDRRPELDTRDEGA